MGRQMPWDDIPDSNVFPTGTYHVTGVKLEERESSTGKLMYAADVQVMEHPNTAMFTNMHHFENFVIGTDDDPGAEVQGTWTQSFGAKRLKQMLKAAQVAEHADMDKICMSFPNTQFLLGLRWFREPPEKNGQPNQYAGQERNDVTGFDKIGAKEPKIEQQPGKATARPAAQAAAPPAQAPPAVAPQQQAFVPPQQPQVQQFQQPVQQQMVPPPGPAVQPPPVQQPLPNTTAAPPQNVAPPTTTASPPPNVAPATQSAQPAGQMLPCNICGQSVPAGEYAAHMEACLAKQAGG